METRQQMDPRRRERPAAWADMNRADKLELAFEYASPSPSLAHPLTPAVIHSSLSLTHSLTHVFIDSDTQSLNHSLSLTATL